MYRVSIVRMTFVCLVSVCKRLCNVRTRSIMCLHLMFMHRSCSVRFPFANGGMQTLHKRLKNVCVLGGEFQTSTTLWLKKVFPEVKATLMFIEFKRVISSCSILCHLKHVIS